jgi:hypothetical protein
MYSMYCLCYREKRKVPRHFLSVIMVVVLASCVSQHAVREEFDESLRGYNELRYRNEPFIAGHYVVESLIEKYLSLVHTSKDVRIVDYRILSTTYNEARGEAEAQVEIEYYSVSTQKVKSLLDTQEWVYIKGKEKGQWMLVSLPPEFK